MATPPKPKTFPGTEAEWEAYQHRQEFDDMLRDLYPGDSAEAKAKRHAAWQKYKYQEPVEAPAPVQECSNLNLADRFTDQTVRQIVSKLVSASKSVHFIAIVSMLFMIALLFPPWIYSFQRPGMGKVYKPAGFGFIFSPPAPEHSDAYFGISIDYTRLTIELIIIITIAMLIVVFASYIKSPKNHTMTIFVFIFLPSMLFGTMLTAWGVRSYRSSARSPSDIIQNANDPTATHGILNPSTEPFSIYPSGLHKPDETYLYTYYDRQGRLVINNLPPSYMQNRGLVLKHVGVGRVKLWTAPDATNKEPPK